jgi:hypothetical protein
MRVVETSSAQQKKGIVSSENKRKEKKINTLKEQLLSQIHWKNSSLPSMQQVLHPLFKRSKKDSEENEIKKKTEFGIHSPA